MHVCVHVCVNVRVSSCLPVYDLSDPVCTTTIFLTQSQHAEKTNVAAIFPPVVKVIPGAFDLYYK